METLEALQARVEEQEQVIGLLLEMVHQMVNDYHAPKAHWERKMLPAWKAHIEKKRAKDKELKQETPQG